MFRSYIEDWLDLSEAEKISILDTSRDKFMNRIGSNKTKKRYMSHVLFDCIGTNHLELFETLIKKVKRMRGNPVDEYYINSVLVEYYKKIDDKNTAIEICVETFKNIDLFLPELKAEQLFLNNITKDSMRKDEIGSLPDYLFCRDGLTFLLIDTYKFADAEKFEILFKGAGLYPDKKDRKREIYNKLLRLESLIDFSILNNDVEIAISNCEIIETINKEKAAYAYKKIGNYYLRKGNDGESLNFLKKSFELNPRIEGIDNKINTLSKKLKIEYKTNKDLIIEELKREEKLSPKWFELRSIANRYLSINEFNESIRIFKNLIDSMGRDNTLIGGLSKTYKAIGNKSFKEKNYEDALKNYNLAIQTIDNPLFPIKSLDMQREILLKMIEKTKAKI